MKLRILTTIVAALLLTGGAVACSPDAGPVSVVVRTSDTAAGLQFARQLPRETTFENRMGTAVVARLATPLETIRSESVSHYRAVAYWEQQQSIVVFLAEGAATPSTALVIVGRVAGDDLSRLSDCVQHCTVRLAVAERG